TKDHVWLNNFTAGTGWQKLTNNTDFVIQDGNSTFFGFRSVLVILNYSLVNSSQTYRIWISNSSDPANSAPSWNNPTSSIPATYDVNKLSVFNVTWADDNDNNGFNASLFETNLTGSAQNFSA